MRNPINAEDKSFALAVRHAKPEEWQLECCAFGTAAAPRVIDMPPYGVDVATHVGKQGFPAGSYRITLERREGTDEDTVRKSKQRLRRYGPLSTVMKVEGDGSVPARRNSTPGQPAFAAAPTINPRADEIAERKAKLELLRIEIEERRLQRELAANVAPEQKPGAPTPWPAIVAALAPIIERLLTGSSRREEAMMRLLAEREPLALPMPIDAPPATPHNTIRDTLDTMRELTSAMTELGTFGGGGEGGGMMGQVAQIVQHLAPMLRQPPPANRLQRPAPAKKTGDPMKLRVVQWLLSVQQAAANDLEPEAAADALFDAFRLLPGAFRKVVLESVSLEALLQGLTPFAPDSLSNQLKSTVATNSAVRNWLEQFLAAMRAPDDDSESAFAEHGQNGSVHDVPASDDDD